jgi:hypothetical protein
VGYKYYDTPRTYLNKCELCAKVWTSQVSTRFCGCEPTPIPTPIPKEITE